MIDYVLEAAAATTPSQCVMFRDDMSEMEKAHLFQPLLKATTNCISCRFGVGACVDRAREGWRVWSASVPPCLWRLRSRLRLSCHARVGPASTRVRLALEPPFTSPLWPTVT